MLVIKMCMKHLVRFRVVEMTLFCMLWLGLGLGLGLGFAYVREGVLISFMVW